MDIDFALAVDSGSSTNWPMSDIDVRAATIRFMTSQAAGSIPVG
jgi:hypothetical protein